jgi:putative nucleotidyltransferase with HDIG domain
MTRDEALELVKSEIKNDRLVKHCLAVEAAMRRLAKHFNEDEERWGLAGLLHDLDYETTADDFSKHGLTTAEMLEGKVDEDIIYAIKAHPGHVEAKSKMDISLYAIDPLTGLIVAACLMHPEKDLTYLDAGFVMRRFKEKSFARGADRDQIKVCERLNISLEEFVSLVLEAMQGIHTELGL